MKAMFQKETARQPSVRGVQKRAGPSHPREGLRIWLLAQQNNRRDVPKRRPGGGEQFFEWGRRWCLFIQTLSSDCYPLRPSGLPITLSTRHGFTECKGPPHSAQRSRAESCAMVSPNEMRGSQLIGLSLVARPPRTNTRLPPAPCPPV
jgi:hypothetical protein